MNFSPGLFELKLELQFEVTTNLTRSQSPSSVHPGTRDLKLNFQLELPVQFPNSPATIELKAELEFPDQFLNSPATIEQELQLPLICSRRQTLTPSPPSVPQFRSNWKPNSNSKIAPWLPAAAQQCFLAYGSGPGTAARRLASSRAWVSMTRRQREGVGPKRDMV